MTLRRFFFVCVVLCAVSPVTTLSGGELQRVAIALCLGTPADVYLIDEPSAYLDSEQRISCSKVHHIGRLKALRIVNLWARRWMMRARCACGWLCLSGD